MKTDIIKGVVQTEKAVNQVSAINTLVLVVDMKATKPEIKEAVEKTFGVKVGKVRTHINFKGQKIAYVKLKEGNAEEVLGKFTA